LKEPARLDPAVPTDSAASGAQSACHRERKTVGTDEVMVGCDPHKRMLTAAVVDRVGVPVDARSFSNSPAGLEAVVQCGAGWTRR
jgi:hypothetical protein